MQTTIINFTPHNINFVDEETKEIYKTVESSWVVRASQQDENNGDINWIPVIKTTFWDAFFIDNDGNEHPIPSKQEGVIYIASIIACNAMPDRDDFYIINGVVKDDNNIIIWARGISKNPNCS